jgi:translation elongation factor EF-1beta
VLCGGGQVSIDLLEEKITDLEDLVQSVDIAAMNKI